MFEVYLNDRHDLLVIEKGAQLPLSSASGKWRKRKKAVRVRGPEGRLLLAEAERSQAPWTRSIENLPRSVGKLEPPFDRPCADVAPFPVIIIFVGKLAVARCAP